MAKPINTEADLRNVDKEVVQKPAILPVDAAGDLPATEVLGGDADGPSVPQTGYKQGGDGIDRDAAPEALTEPQEEPAEDPALVPSMFANQLDVIINPDNFYRSTTDNTEGQEVPLSAGLGGTYKMVDGVRVRVFEDDTPQDETA